MNHYIPLLRTLHLFLFLGLALAMPAMAADDETPLEKEMATINKGYKLLGKQARTGKFDYAALGKAFAQAKSAAEAASELVPAKIAKMKDGAAKKREHAAYKKQIGALTKQLSAIIAICKEKDDAKLKAAVEELKKTKKQGHDKFIEDE